MKNPLVFLALMLFLLPFATGQEITRAQNSTKAIAVDVEGPVMYSEPGSDEEQKKLTLGEEIEKTATVTVFPDAHVHFFMGGQLFTLHEPGTHDLGNLIDAGELGFVSGFVSGFGTSVDSKDSDADAKGDTGGDPIDDTSTPDKGDDTAGNLSNTDSSNKGMDDTGATTKDESANPTMGDKDPQPTHDPTEGGSEFDAEFFKSAFVETIYDGGTAGWAAPALGWGKGDCLTPTLADGSLVTRDKNCFTWDAGDSKSVFRFEVRDASDNKVVFMALTRSTHICADLSSLDVKENKKYYWQIKEDKEKSTCSEKVGFELVPVSDEKKVLEELTTGADYRGGNTLLKLLKKAKALEEAGFYYAADEIYRIASKKYDNSMIEMMRTRNARLTAEDRPDAKR